MTEDEYKAQQMNNAETANKVLKAYVGEPPKMEQVVFKTTPPSDLDAIAFKQTDPPQDGSTFYARYLTPMRWKPYSPKSQEFKRGIKGRWQMMNEYGGWDNTRHLPDDWMTHDEYMGTRTGKAEGG